MTSYSCLLLNWIMRRLEKDVYLTTQCWVIPSSLYVTTNVEKREVQDGTNFE